MSIHHIFHVHNYYWHIFSTFFKTGEQMTAISSWNSIAHSTGSSQMSPGPGGRWTEPSAPAGSGRASNLAGSTFNSPLPWHQTRRHLPRLEEEPAPVCARMAQAVLASSCPHRQPIRAYVEPCSLAHMVASTNSLCQQKTQLLSRKAFHVLGKPFFSRNGNKAHSLTLSVSSSLSSVVLTYQ